MENQQVAKKKGLEYWQQIIIMLCLGWTVIWIYRSALSPIFPELNLSLGGGISDSSLGAIASFYFFGYTGMQIPAGILVDKFGKKMVLIPGFTLFALAAIVIANANGITMVYAGSLMAGIGCGSYYGSAYSLSSESIPQERRGLSTAIINSGSAVGMGIGLILSSLLVKQLGLPWQIMMYLVAILVVLIMIVFIKVIRTTPDAVVNHPTAKAKHDPEDKVSMSTLFAPHMIASYILYFATCYGYYMVVTWLPSFLQQERGFEGVAIGFSAALVAFSAIPGALFFSRLSDKFQDKKIHFIVVLELLAAAMLVLTVMAPTSGVLLVGLVLYGLLGKLAVEPIIISYIGDTAPKKGYGTTFGVFNFFGMSSSVLAPWVTGVISDATGSKVNGFFLSAIIMVVGTVLFLGANIMMKNKKAKAE
ncbi:Major facilitator family transporter [Carnobacterium maltaromaticum]|uniref:MFS transporter n=1 Tax=Carnobacterium maltaromaticum TaxID=2751 RepID=UPI00191BAB34|nr:MFS transporter [Carnobacterium maltaromaticum]CAD5898507.1 Major facilitator family transporter [Carnobacterium maltaromaticum]